MNSVKNDIINTLRVIYERILNHDFEGSFGFTNGEIGASLFIYEYYKFNKDQETLDELYRRINKAIDLIENAAEVNGGLANGLAGFGLTLSYMQEQGLLDVDFSEILSQVDELLIDVLDLELKNGNYDYLYGAIGIGNYFLQREGKVADEILEKIFVSLSEKGISLKKNEFKWKAHISEYKDNIDLGLAHGMPSTLVFIASALKKNEKFEKYRYLLEGATNFIYSSRNKRSIGMSTFYPNAIPAEQVESRLAWCYGDLSVVCSLDQANQSLNDIEISNHIDELYNSLLNRKDLNRNRIEDPYFCHGASGVAFIFYCKYIKSQNDKFLKGANYWYSTTLDLLKQLGLRSNMIQEDLSALEYGVLTGISGIGLSMVSSLTGSIDWKKMLLI